MSSAPRALAVLVAVITAFGALLADFVIPAGAAQHLRNDAWPPHAKFQMPSTSPCRSCWACSR
ncbi:hypothetical protein [Nocardia fluminea]|uniref:hypothetical protein n=1 Tax=Nocardia fluminea TaxID=134984 RepID=UPI00343E5D5E